MLVALQNKACLLRSYQYKKKPMYKKQRGCVCNNNVSFISDPLSESLVHNSAIIGEYFGLFVLFTATLNWMSYRRIRKMMEDDKK
jgi:hypothetical protein